MDLLLPLVVLLPKSDNKHAQKSVQLVRGSSFRSDFLQSPYFSGESQDPVFDALTRQPFIHGPMTKDKTESFRLSSSVLNRSLFALSYMCQITDYGHMEAKSLILCQK